MKIQNLLVVALIGLVACQKNFTETGNAVSAKAQIDNITFTTLGNRFGVYIDSSYSNQTPGASDARKLLDANTKPILDSVYGAKNIRIQVSHDNWPTATYRNSFLTTFKSLWKNGFSPAVNIKWYGSPGPTGHDFADSTQYAAFVGEVLDSIQGRSDAGQTMKPGIVVVENEETNPTYYHNSTQSDLQKYVGMLRMAADTCAQRSIPVTNGGIVVTCSIVLTWNWLKSTYSLSVANKWANKVLPSTKVGSLGSTTNNQINSLGTFLVNSYTQIPNLSFVNIHWYEPVIARSWPETGLGSPYPGISKDSVVAGGLDSVVRYFNQKIASKKVITNETGQLTYSGTLTANMIDKYTSLYNTTANFPMVIWYDGDDNYTEAISGAKALHNTGSTTSYSLRASGSSFQNKMQ